MRFFSAPAKILALLVLLVAVVTSSRATTVRGGSTYGDNAGLLGCEAKIDAFLADSSNLDNCEGSAATTFIIGGNTYNGALFAFLQPDGLAFGVLDIISLTANSTLTLNLVNPLAPTGVFMCGSFGIDLTVAQDSNNADMTGLPCTAGSSPLYSGTLNLANVQVNFSGNEVTFVNGTSSELVVFTEDGNIQGTTTAPEPGSLMLLGVGLLALGRKFHRSS
jgi:PEP-CTERM motif